MDLEDSNDEKQETKLFQMGMVACEVNFNSCPFWIHIVGISHDWPNERKLAKIGSALSEVVEIDLSPSSGRVKMYG